MMMEILIIVQDILKEVRALRAELREPARSQLSPKVRAKPGPNGKGRP